MVNSPTIAVIHRADYSSANYPVTDLLTERCDCTPIFEAKPPVILITFSGVQFPALLDTGSDVCCLSGSVIDQIEACCEDLVSFPVSGIRVTGAFRAARRTVTRQVFLSFTLAGHDFSHEFLIIPELAYPVIVGIDWLRLEGVRFELDKRRLYLTNRDVFVEEVDLLHDFERSDSPRLKVCTINNETL